MATGKVTSGQSTAVRIEGLADFQRELRKMGKEGPRALRKANKDVAEPVARDARRLAQREGGALGKAAPTIRAAGEARRSKVAIGGARAPYALGGEFGAINMPGKYGPKGRPRYWRGNQWTADPPDIGYALHPTVHDWTQSGQLVDVYDDMIKRLSRQAFPS